MSGSNQIWKGKSPCNLCCYCCPKRKKKIITFEQFGPLVPAECTQPYWPLWQKWADFVIIFSLVNVDNKPSTQMYVLFSVCPASKVPRLTWLLVILPPYPTHHTRLSDSAERETGFWAHIISLIASHAEPCQFLQITITDTTAGLSVPHFTHLFPSISSNTTPAISPSPLHPYFSTLPLLLSLSCGHTFLSLTFFFPNTGTNCD